jgi:phage protein D
MADYIPTSGKGAGLDNLSARYNVEIDGKSYDQQGPMGLEAMTVEDHVDMVGVAEITFSAAGTREPKSGGSGESSEDPQAMLWDSIKVGAEVKVKVGAGGVDNGSGVKTAAPGQRQYAFVGIITGLRHSFIKSKDSITILAMDPLCKLAASRRTKVYEDKKDSDIVTEVLGEAGLTVGNVEATTETRKYVLQRNESDFNFLRRLAARNGYLLQSNDGKIDFAKAQYSAKAVEYRQQDIISLDYSFSDRSIPKKVTAYGWDYIKKERVEGSATVGDIDKIGGGDNSVEKTGQVFQGESYITDVFVDSQDGAKELAKSHLNQLARNFLRGRAIIQGSASVTAGSKVKFLSTKGKFQPEGYVLSARTRVYVGSGETTEVVFCSNTHPNG